QGRVDDVRIYNYALSPEEIAALAVDLAPPVVKSLTPVDNAITPAVERIVIVLEDTRGDVDAAVVKASIRVRDDQDQEISGVATAENDVFTFIPDSLPMEDGVYQVSFTAADMAGNSAEHACTFTKDAQPPAPPVITGGGAASGPIQARPAENQSASLAVTLTGTRENGAAVWIDGAEAAMAGDGDWTVALTLNQGENALEIWLEDNAGNRGESVWVDILADSI
ncbi:MAG: hypothetical protein GY838_07515, partial [bacterium]|nr:hypothetical protein [bacterium]